MILYITGVYNSEYFSGIGNSLSNLGCVCHKTNYNFIY